MSVYFLGILFIALIASSQCRPRHIQTNCVEIFMSEVDDSFRDEKVAGYCSRNSHSAYKLNYSLTKLIGRECTALCKCVHFDRPDVDKICEF